MKPKKCCKPGEFSCQVPMPINGRLQGIDYCIAHIIAALNAANIKTLASCCGHGEITGSIILDDGRELVVRKYDEKNYVNVKE
jgi:hypothetical protein